MMDLESTAIAVLVVTRFNFHWIVGIHNFIYPLIFLTRNRIIIRETTAQFHSVHSSSPQPALFWHERY